MNQERYWDRVEECRDVIDYYAYKYSKILGDMDLRQDLKHDGMLGAHRAAKSFDPERGVQFATYAQYYIREAILESIEENFSFMRIPKYKRIQMQKVMKLFTEYSHEMDENLCIRLIADELELSTEEVDDCITLSYRMRHSVSLDSTISEDDETTVGEMTPAEVELSVEEEVMQRLLREQMQEALETLQERESAILRMRYGDEKKTYEEIGKIFNISGARAKQIEKAALEKLRKSKKIQQLWDYLVA